MASSQDLQGHKKNGGYLSAAEILGMGADKLSENSESSVCSLRFVAINCKLLQVVQLLSWERPSKRQKPVETPTPRGTA